jgi:hypothetical protein
MEPEEVVELCEEFFSDLEGEEEYWVSLKGKNRPAFKLVEVDVDDDRVSLIIEIAPGLDEDDEDGLIKGLMDRAISAMNDEHEELTDYRFGYKLDTE